MKTDELNQGLVEDTRESVSFGTRDKDFSKEPLCLSGRGVTRVFHTGKVTTVAVDHVDFDFHKGELISIVGESGSGKSVTASAIMGITADPGRIVSGTVLFNGHNIGELDEKDVKAIADHIMGQTPEGFNKKNADLNGDGMINAADIVELLNKKK